jgi:ABC-2 type transport system ATP-binding protein
LSAGYDPVPPDSTDGCRQAAPNRQPVTAWVNIRAVSVFYGRRLALDDVSLSLPKGAKTALLGPNGAGKSTLMKVVCGVLAPDLGQAMIGDLNSLKARTAPLTVGWLPERAPLNPELTVSEHLKLAARLRGLNRAEETLETERLSEALNLGDKLNRLAGALSLGSRRQAALALAFLGQPSLIVLDEPTSSLDPDEVRRLKVLLADLSLETTLLISSHVLTEVAELTDQVVILKDGRLAACGLWKELPGGTPQEIYFQAAGGGL